MNRLTALINGGRGRPRMIHTGTSPLTTSVSVARTGDLSPQTENRMPLVPRHILARVGIFGALLALIARVLCKTNVTALIGNRPFPPRANAWRAGKFIGHRSGHSRARSA